MSSGTGTSGGSCAAAVRPGCESSKMSMEAAKRRDGKAAYDAITPGGRPKQNRFPFALSVAPQARSRRAKCFDFARFASVVYAEPVEALSTNGSWSEIGEFACAST